VCANTYVLVSEQMFSRRT